jgi:hypothetical protein
MIDNDLEEARSIALYLWNKHYMDDSPNFELCDSMSGVLSQIDNMVTGLTRLKGTT